MTRATPGREARAEARRLEAARDGTAPWKRWGPYLSERQWGTVREDYSDRGDAWNYFTHDQARSRAYRWGEDGLGGISDERQRLCFSVALWNGQDPILKERLFGLTNAEGNHGEDVKEYYFYLDSTPTHSFMQYLYKYPQRAFPYADLVATNGQRTRQDFEYELLDTGIFDDDRYFDLFVEYAKASPEDILVAIRAVNRGPEAATLHVLPTLWYRNTWSWTEGVPRPILERAAADQGMRVVAATHAELGRRFLCCAGAPALLFTENETNHQRLFGTPNRTPFVKDAFHEFVVHGHSEAVNPAQRGTKVAGHYAIRVRPGETAVIRLRLTDTNPGARPAGDLLGPAFDETLAARRLEADEFYRSITPPSVGDDVAREMRQALAGMLWSKQYYYFDGDQWLREHGVSPLSPVGGHLRNRDWFHMINDDVISMPDKWEYPWYAAWDLAFHTVALGMVDMDFAKNQLDLMLDDVYLHPSGQVPAYEWNFGDVNPPVHAWAALFLYRSEELERGQGDVEYLKRLFNKTGGRGG